MLDDIVQYGAFFNMLFNMLDDDIDGCIVGILFFCERDDEI